MPELQRQKVFQLIAPFTLEVGNLWNVQKDFLSDKDFGALAILYGSNFLLNEAMESIRGSRVVFDPIQAVKEGLQESEGEGLMDRAGKVAGSLAGETLGNTPLGSSIGTIYPEFGFGEVLGFNTPTREKLFGENDPTRFGTDLGIVKAIQDPLKSLVLPYGGGQIKKTLQGGQALGVIPKLEGGELVFDQNARNKKGKLITPTLQTPSNIIKGLLFGKYAIDEVKEFYDKDGRVFSELQTGKFGNLVDSKGYEPNQLFKAINEYKKELKKTLVPAIGVKTLKFIYNWEAFWEYKEPLALVVAIVLILVMALVINLVDRWRVTHGTRM